GEPSKRVIGRTVEGALRPPARRTRSCHPCTRRALPSAEVPASRAAVLVRQSRAPTRGSCPLGRTPDLPPLALGRVIDGDDRGLSLDASYGPFAHAGELGGLALGVAGLPEHLNLVALDHVQHSSPRPGWFPERWSYPERLALRTGQNFWNSH